MSFLAVPVFAFGFASPWLLWGLAVAGAPVLIHLLNRRKFRETQWAAMKFLLEAVRKNSRRIRIEQLILLAVRTLLLILVTLALSRPYIEELGTYFQADQPVHKLIVLDATYSMGCQPGDANLFERAKDIARKIAEDSGQGDAINVLRISDLPPIAIVETPSFQPADVVTEIDQLQLPHGRGRLLPCLRKLEELLKLASQVPRKEIYFVSDFQRATWTADSADELSEIRGTLKRLDDQGAIVLVDIGQPGADNTAVTSLSAIESFAGIGKPVRFKASVRNFGSQPTEDQALDLLVDGKLVEQRRIELAPGAEAAESFSHTFTAGGEHRVQVRVQKDGLPLDDQRWLAVPVKDQVRVLCVNGHTASGRMGRATDFLELALSPTAGNRGSSDIIAPQVVNEGELQGLDLQKFDCLFLCNVGLFTPREAELVASYLRGGGGVVWCLGDHVQVDSYNQVLAADGNGILPARVGERRGNPRARKEAFEFRAEDLSHPIVNAFQGNPDAGLEKTKTYAYFKLLLPAHNRSRVALRFDSGDPAIVEMPVGTGKSILLATSVDDRWGNWALWPTFVPLMHEVVHFAISGRWGERQHLVGEPLSQTFPATAVDVEVAVSRPDGQSRTAPMVQSGNLSQFSYEQTDLSGIYEVTLAHPLSRHELYAVNVDPLESDLTKLAHDELGSELLSGIDFAYHTQYQDHTTQAEAPVMERGGLTRWLLYAALYLLFVEQMLAWNFQAGIWLLCPLLLPIPLVAAAFRMARK